MTARPLAIAFLMALVASVSPFNTGTAQADGICPDGSMCMGIQTLVGSDNQDVNPSADDTGLILMANSAPWWVIRPKDDGSFQIVNQKTNSCVGFNAEDNKLNHQSCSDDASLNWFLQPTVGNRDTGGMSYRIRNVSNNKCMDLDHGNTADGTSIMLWDCNGADNQEWTVSTPPDYAKANDLATRYALKLFEEGSDLVQEATYDVTDSTSELARRGPYEIVSVASQEGGSGTFCSNSAGPDKTAGFSCTMSWQQSVADTTTTSTTYGVSVTVGTGSKSPVKAEVAAKFEQTFSRSKTTTATEGSSVQITVPRGQTGWVARALAYKTVTGKWTFVTDGVEWTGRGAATMPVEGVDGTGSDLTGCFTDSTDERCEQSLANSPVKP
ncbi:RICIN domain-containing protein [Streptomyces tubercidicus]|uniref:RICIN domain-containing protein n=1 Tax=Streptomyces tubercidicus TaxID=47759 RepID=UPI0037B1C733